VVLPAPVGPTMAMVVAGDRALGVRDRRRVGAVRDLVCLIQELEDALGRGDGGLEDIGDVGGLHDGPGELLGVLNKRLDIADGDLAARHQDTADHADQHVTEVADEVHQRHDDAGDKLRFPARRVEPLVDRIEGVDRLGLVAERLDDGVPGIHLLHVAVEHAQFALLCHEVALRALGDQSRHQDVQGQGNDDDPREQRADREHHDHDAHDGDERGNKLCQALLQRGGDCVDVVRHPTEDLAVRPRVEKRERQAGQLVVDIGPHVVDSSLCDPGHDVLLDVAEERANGVETDQEQQNVPDAAEIHGWRRPAGPCRDDLGDDACEDLGGDLAHQFRADDVEHRAQNGTGQDHAELHAMRPEIPQQPNEGATKVLRLFDRPSHPAPRAAHGTAPRPARRPLLLSLRAHAISSSESWDATISR